MRRRRTIAGVVGAVALALPATALASSLDTASTTKFVAASSQVVSAALAKQSQEKAAANALISHVESTCPGAVPANLANGTEAQRHTWQAFSGEAVAEFALALTGPIRSAEQRAVRAIAPLRWTSATVNKEVAAFVQQGRATLALHPPDICAQARASAASGFAVVPPATATFIKRYSLAAPGSAPTVVDLAKKMKPLVDSQTATAIAQLAGLESRLSRDLSRFTFSGIGKLGRALSS